MESQVVESDQYGYGDDGQSDQQYFSPPNSQLGRVFSPNMADPVSSMSSNETVAMSNSVPLQPYPYYNTMVDPNAQYAYSSNGMPSYQPMMYPQMMPGVRMYPVAVPPQHQQQMYSQTAPAHMYHNPYVAQYPQYQMFPYQSQQVAPPNRMVYNAQGNQNQVETQPPAQDRGDTAENGDVHQIEKAMSTVSIQSPQNENSNQYNRHQGGNRGFVPNGSVQHRGRKPFFDNRQHSYRGGNNGGVRRPQFMAPIPGNIRPKSWTAYITPPPNQYQYGDYNRRFPNWGNMRPPMSNGMPSMASRGYGNNNNNNNNGRLYRRSNNNGRHNLSDGNIPQSDIRRRSPVNAVPSAVTELPPEPKSPERGVFELETPDTPVSLNSSEVQNDSTSKEVTSPIMIKKPPVVVKKQDKPLNSTSQE